MYSQHVHLLTFLLILNFLNCDILTKGTIANCGESAVKLQSFSQSVHIHFVLPRPGRGLAIARLSFTAVAPSVWNCRRPTVPICHSLLFRTSVSTVQRLFIFWLRQWHYCCCRRCQFDIFVSFETDCFNTQHSIVVRPTAVHAISTDIIVQHCRTSDLELTATCRIKLRLSLSLSTFKSRLKTHLFSTAFC